MKTVKSLRVLYRDRLVGTLALTREKKIAFEYAPEWLEDGFSISPFSLPLEKGVFLPSKPYFNGLFGVFADSLPDAWGNILLNRVLRKYHISPDELNALDRLSIVGSSGMGALTYEPETRMDLPVGDVALDVLARECSNILASRESDELDVLYRLGGTSGGARPKITKEADGKSWIIKFPTRIDGASAGKMEYEYSLCAKQCGIQMTETRLFPSGECDGYFGIERFDRSEGQRVHMLTAAALLELNFEEPSLDYHSLMKLTKILTRDSEAEMEEMYRRMCFNVYAHNRDDHSKNFTFLYHEPEDRWRLSPAYDLTYSTTYYGEHTTSVDGNGKNPSKRELMNVGRKAGLSKKRCEEILEQVKSCVDTMLGKYLQG